MTSAPPPVLRPHAPSEKDVQRAIMQLIRTCGGTVWSTSQTRPSRVGVGLPDLIAFHPRAGLAFIEVKSERGRQRPEQVTFQALCEAAGETYLLADRPEIVRDWIALARTSP